MGGGGEGGGTLGGHPSPYQRDPCGPTYLYLAGARRRAANDCSSPQCQHTDRLSLWPPLDLLHTRADDAYVTRRRVHDAT